MARPFNREGVTVAMFQTHSSGRAIEWLAVVSSRTPRQTKTTRAPAVLQSQEMTHKHSSTPPHSKPPGPLHRTVKPKLQTTSEYNQYPSICDPTNDRCLTHKCGYNIGDLLQILTTLLEMIAHPANQTIGINRKS